jgi:hypothetical protein
MPAQFGLGAARFVDIEVITPSGGQRRVMTVRRVDSRSFASCAVVVRVGSDTAARCR